MEQASGEPANNSLARFQTSRRDGMTALQRKGVQDFLTELCQRGKGTFRRRMTPRPVCRASRQAFWLAQV